jgi:hypothetical protein
LQQVHKKVPDVVTPAFALLVMVDTLHCILQF